MTFPTFASHMPRETERAHFEPAQSDCLSAILSASHRPLGADGVRALDFNMQVVIVTINGHRVPVAIGAHWFKIGWNGMTHVVTEHGVRALTRRERRMTYQQWANAHGGDVKSILSLRRANGDRPLLWEEAVSLAKEHGVVLTPELKSQKFGWPSVAAHMVAVCKQHDYPLWAMSLLWMKNCKEKCHAIIDAGGQFAIIFGNRQYLALGPNRVKRWALRPTQVWGPRRAKRWLDA